MGRSPFSRPSQRTAQREAWGFRLARVLSSASRRRWATASFQTREAMGWPRAWLLARGFRGFRSRRPLEEEVPQLSVNVTLTSRKPKAA
uniref:Uncharacterized protein n=1 Tax=Oryza barthii TaxID=65489 RepID=A0A0D3F9G9_9ORYZ